MRIDALIKLNAKTQAGFSLLEVVIAIVLTGIIYAVVALNLAHPIKAFNAVAQRAQLVDGAEMALRRIEHEVRHALPNSIRVKQVGAQVGLEFIHVQGGYRYRTEDPGGAAEILSFAAADDSFAILGQFPSAMLGSLGYRVVIYNTGAQGLTADAPLAGANAYASLPASGGGLPPNSHVITPSSTTVTLANVSGNGRVTLSAPHLFALASPYQRVFIIDTPVSYLCDTSTQLLIRYSGYGLQDVQPVDPAAAPLSIASQARLSELVSACAFSYQPGTAQRNSVVILDMTLALADEQVRLLQQVSVTNAP